VWITISIWDGIQEVALGIVFALAEIPPECKEVESEAEGDGPFEDGGWVLFNVEKGTEGYGENDENGGDEALDYVYPSETRGVKRFPEPSELYYAEDGAKSDSQNEDEKKDAMKAGMTFGVKNGKENEAAAAEEGAGACQSRHYSFPLAKLR